MARHYKNPATDFKGESRGPVRLVRLARLARWLDSYNPRMPSSGATVADLAETEALPDGWARPSEERGDEMARALSEIAGAVASALELREVFSRVAEATRRVLDFGAIGVTRIGADGSIVLHAVAGADRGEESGTPIQRDEISRVLWPEDFGPGGAVRIADAPLELDLTFPLDRQIVERGWRSILFGPLRRGDALLGSVWFTAAKPSAFRKKDEETLAAIANMLVIALEHERLSTLERERRRRYQLLDALPGILAQALDVRDVFGQLSSIAREVLPHDRLVLGLLNEARTAVRLYAYSGDVIPGLPESFELLPEERPQLDWDFHIIGDVEKDLDKTSERYRLMKLAGIRSALRVPIRMPGRVVAGGLVFHSRAVSRYHERDVEIARRVADEIALALSHQRLAEEARRADEAKETAERLTARVARLTAELESRDGFHRVIGKSRKWRDVLVQATKVAGTDTTVLLTGESGTGKEVIARALHRASPRAEGPFVAINCAALPDQLLESELFGYERGAFTGAAQTKPGRIEQAASGVLFLDEVGEMSPMVQAKFLRVLEEREFQRLGGTRTLKTDVRVIAATNRDLKDAIRRGAFREDLYYRLHVFEIALPPLRERVEDILPLTERFLEDIGRVIGRSSPGVSKEALERLLSYPWPGNVRELRNAIERALILCEGGLIAAEHLPISIGEGAVGVAAATPNPALSAGQAAAGRPAGAFALPAEGVDLESLERTLVEEALLRTSHNRTRAARLLGLTRAQLYSRLEKYGLGSKPEAPAVP